MLASVALLVGCSGSAIGGIVENATGGNVDVGGSTVPEDFPAEIPLYDGEVISGAGIGNDDAKVWNVSVRVPDASAIDAIETALTGAGFVTKASGTPTTDAGALVLASANFGVLVAVVKDEGGFVANYSVTKLSSGN